MFKKIAVTMLLSGLLSPLSLAGDMTQEDSLVLRFTGPEAERLTGFLKERFKKKTDFDKIQFHGERMSLACSEHGECYLWLVRKEWQVESAASANTLLHFTLPLKQTVASGQLSLSPAGQVQLQLQDRYFPGSFAFQKPIDCKVLKGSNAPLQSSGDCQVHLSNSPKKAIPSTPSVQYIQNLDNILLSFKGPWAKKLFTSAPSPETDPHDAKRLRAQIGPELYCWNRDPLDENPYLDDTFVCQGNFIPQNGSFTAQGSLKDNKDLTLTLKPTFRNGLLENFNLTLHLEGKEWPISRCPGPAGSGYGQCTLFYDMKIDSGRYPIGNSVQGVAVGWGIIKKPPTEN